MEENNGFTPQPSTVYHSIKYCLFKAAINGAERLMLDGNKKHKITPFTNRGSSPVSESSETETLMIRTTHYKPEPFLPISTFIKLPHFLLMKLIAFQFHLLTSFLTFPIRASSVSIIALKHAVLGHLTVKKIVLRLCGAVVDKAIGGETMKCSTLATRGVAVKVGRGVVWSCCVGLVLVGMLVCGFLFGSLVVNSVMEPPFKGKEGLNFDYTKDSPVAYLPYVVPHNRTLKLTVMLMMPESDYNRNLGMFQVRVELLSSMGKVTKTTSSACMLPFKSHPIRLAETMIKTLPLLLGAISESQTVELRMDQLSQDDLHDPTASIRVSLNQRAEFKEVPGAGIPQVYAAWLKLESELPPAKRFMWQWRRTVHVWAGILLFLTELVLAFVFCMPMIVPMARFGRNPIFKRLAAKKYVE